MSALTASPRHPWELLLEQLTGRSKLAHAWGDEAAAKTAPVDHITWTAGDPATEPRTFNLAGQEVVCLLAVPHTVTVYGGSPAAVMQRVADMMGQIDLLAGPPKGSNETTPPRPGYGFQPAKAALRGGELGAGAWMAQPIVTLKLFVVRAINGAQIVGTVGISVVAEDALGANAEQGPPNASRPVP